MISYKVNCTCAHKCSRRSITVTPVIILKELRTTLSLVQQSEETVSWKGWILAYVLGLLATADWIPSGVESSAPMIFLACSDDVL